MSVPEEPLPPFIAAVNVTSGAVLDLYTQYLEADTDGCSSNDVAQILDDWFVAQGFPTVLYREKGNR